MAENRKYPTMSSGSLPYKISTKFVKLFMGYFEKSIYGIMHTKFCYGSMSLKIANSPQIRGNFPHRISTKSVKLFIECR
jgi:16S rRNA A1518/A1519 N6-dimethyltransferase RsmA/KsgA/DIM1 with predicted DNA glycosylase/AP lyase activity